MINPKIIPPLSANVTAPFNIFAGQRNSLIFDRQAGDVADVPGACRDGGEVLPEQVRYRVGLGRDLSRDGYQRS
jgi:hypothetical protein